MLFLPDPGEVTKTQLPRLVKSPSFVKNSITCGMFPVSVNEFDCTFPSLTLKPC